MNMLRRVGDNVDEYVDKGRLGGKNTIIHMWIVKNDKYSGYRQHSSIVN